MVKGIFKVLVFPISMLYGLVVRIRNILFNTGVIKSHKFRFPILSVGNLAVGGTGKTPHIEYLIQTLRKEFKIAVLSRGYKRKTSGFIIAGNLSSASEIGDEPAQIKRKFPELVVAVDADRTNGINRLLLEKPDLDLILLDDAFQHRKVEPGLSILLSDYSNLFTKDYLMPSGRLREHRSNAKRSDFILITRSPLDLSAIDRRIMVNNIPLRSHQHLYFTSVVYKEPLPFSSDTKEPLCLSKIAESNRSILLITGIADPQPIYSYLNVFSKNIVHMSYPDHHFFTVKDIDNITDEYNKLPVDNRCVITTEKDAERLKEFNNIASRFDKNVYVLPIGINFLNNDAQEFNNFINSYVRKTKSNNSIS